MALIQEFFERQSDVQRVHAPVTCGYRSFTVQGKRYLQLDTYGTEDRVKKGAISQSIQLDEEAAEKLMRLLLETFPSLRGKV